MRLSRSPNAPVLLIGEAVLGNIRLIEEPNVFRIDLTSMQLLQHSVYDSLVCINSRSTKQLKCLKYRTQKHVEVVAYDIVNRHVSQSNLSCSMANGDQGFFLDHLLKKLNICFCNRHTQTPDIIMMNTTSPLKNFRQCLYSIPFQTFRVIKHPLKTAHSFNNFVVFTVSEIPR